MSPAEVEEIKRHTYMAAVNYFCHPTVAHDQTYRNQLEIHQRKLGYAFESEPARVEAERMKKARDRAKRASYKARSRNGR